MRLETEALSLLSLLSCGAEADLDRRRLEEECQRLDKDLRRVASEWHRLWDQRTTAAQALGSAPRPLPMRSTFGAPAELDPSITLQARLGTYRHRCFQAPQVRRCGSSLVGEP